MARLFIILVFGFFSSFNFCQNHKISPDRNVISSQGGTVSTDFIILEWTLGEGFVETVPLNGTILTQGFHQSNLVDDLGLVQSNLRIFPNPVDTQLQIHLPNNYTSETIFSIFDITGNLIYTQIMLSSTNKYIINVQHLSIGFYVLHISDVNNSLIEIQKIVKY